MKIRTVFQTMLWLVLFALTSSLLPERYMSGNYYTQASAQQDEGTDRPRKNKRRGPPQEAVTACDGLNEGEVCSFESPRGDLILGTCEMTRADIKACVPQGGPPDRPSGPDGDRAPSQENGY